MPWRRGLLAVICGLFVCGSPGAAELVWHVESLDGEVLASQQADTTINPASVVKVATTLWALETLGPDHRFETHFATRAPVEGRVMKGDLIVVGDGDPDFHIDNGFLVARALQYAGVSTVDGDLRVGPGFWVGWENGSDGVSGDDARRRIKMATRLRESLDPELWGNAAQKAHAQMTARRGLRDPRPARVQVRGDVGGYDGERPDQVIVTHRSNPLVLTLKRFKAYSNNDLERLGSSLGTPPEMARWLTTRWELPADKLRFETLSGLGQNRMTAREVVRLLHDLRRTAGKLDLAIENLMPVVGCDPGTLEAYDRLAQRAERALVGKTGTLTTTDGGVSVLAGFVSTAAGEQVFVVAQPRSGKATAAGRDRLEQWLLDRITAAGGIEQRECGDRLAFSDTAIKLLRPSEDKPR